MIENGPNDRTVMGENGFCGLKNMGRGRVMKKIKRGGGRISERGRVTVRVRERRGGLRLGLGLGLKKEGG